MKSTEMLTTPGQTSSLYEIFWPPVLNDDYLYAARKRLVASMSLLIGCIGVLSGSLSFMATLEAAPFLSLYRVLCPIIVLIVPLFVARTGRIDLGGLILVIYITIHLTILAISNDGSLWPTAIYLSGIPFLAALILGARYGIIVSSIIIFDVLILTYLTVPGWVGFTLIMLIISSIAAITIFQSQMENTTQRLVELKNEAQNANEAKSDFIASMSHEIRTPLNGIIGILQLLKDFEQSDDQKNLLEIGSSSANSMLTILNDVLDISKIAANGIQLETISFNRDQIVDSVFSSMGHIANEKNIQLKLSIDESIPLRIKGDPVRLQQVVMNFVSNALKFTENGVVEIRMERGSYRDEIKISVTDTGIGMSQEACARVFEKFQQAEKSTTRQYGGTGLGLAIAKQLVELHNGKIGVTSKPGSGSVFWFTFPLIEGEAFSESEEHQTRATISFNEHTNVLVAEDNRTNRLIISRFLNKLKIQPIITKDGQEVINESLKNKFDIIFMDIQMPNKDGITATQEIRQKSNPNAQTPIIALSANAMREQKLSYIQKGMTACLEKPLKMQNLVEILKEYLDYSEHKNIPSDTQISNIARENTVVH